MERFKLAIAQANPTIGDFEGNLALAMKAITEARAEGAEIILFTELFLCGYPAEDLLRKPAFLAAAQNAIDKLLNFTSSVDIAVLIGAPIREEGHVYNAALFIAQGQVLAKSYKRDLPNYAEFDEKRLFAPGKASQSFSYKGVCFGMPICEDIWNEEAIAKELLDAKADIILVPNASPYQRNKLEARLELVRNYARKTRCPVVYANQLGGQDGLVFDGGSFACDAKGQLILQMPRFKDALAYIDWQLCEDGWSGLGSYMDVPLTGLAADYYACVLGLRDYVQKNNFTSVMLGLSGGIDSALCAAIAVDALGAENVYCFMLPYLFTSEESQNDAIDCAKALGCFYDSLPIDSAMQALTPLLQGAFANIESGEHEAQGLWHENLQSRLRGSILMALSNKFGHLLITTGNKSELAVGYCTLYGDTNGGFNPIKDLYKTEVYELAAWRNANFMDGLRGKAAVVVPDNILVKPASAELRDGQKDQDSLPPYELLDKILYELVENDKSVAELVQLGYEEALVKNIENLVYLAEYKRRQSAPGVKVSAKDFNKDRRYPITNKFRDNYALS